MTDIALGFGTYSSVLIEKDRRRSWAALQPASSSRHSLPSTTLYHFALLFPSIPAMLYGKGQSASKSVKTRIPDQQQLDLHTKLNRFHKTSIM